MKILSITVAFAALFHFGLASAGSLADGDTPVDNCDSLRLPGRCTPAPLSAEHNMPKVKIPGRKMEITRKLTLPAQPTNVGTSNCEAHFNTSYLQMNDQVKVVTTVKNEICGASHGVFTLRLRTLTETGETLTRSFSESWMRRNEEAALVTTYYPMQGSTDLIWVRVGSSRKTACLCN
jgi:hypothetical protein